jgi:hypothetical protein
MGRPLNKKYFGNRNSPTIGGEGVASVTLGTLGSYTTRPTVTFSAPTNPTGVTATGTVTSEALSAAVTVGGTGYLVGDLLTVTTVGGSAIFRVATLAGDGSTGEVATVDFGTGASRGSFEALPSGAQATTDNSVAGADATLTITFRAKAVVITAAGSGYVDATDAAPTFTQSVTGTSVLTSAKENAITMTGRVVAGSTVALDVIKQVGSRRYLVTDGTNTGVVELQSTAVDAAGEAQIVATDSASGTYYVTKLTAHRAVVTPGTGTQFTAGQSVPWVLDTAVLNTSVKIPNA